MATTNGTGSGARDVVAQARRVGQETAQLRETVRDAAASMGRKVNVSGFVNDHPYQALGIALGVGYVLGGGLFSRFTGRLVRLGLRFAVLPALKDEVASLLQTAAGLGER